MSGDYYLHVRVEVNLPFSASYHDMDLAHRWPWDEQTNSWIMLYISFILYKGITMPHFLNLLHSLQFLSKMSSKYHCRDVIARDRQTDGETDADRQTDGDRLRYHIPITYPCASLSVYDHDITLPYHTTWTITLVENLLVNATIIRTDIPYDGFLRVHNVLCRSRINIKN